MATRAKRHHVAVIHLRPKGPDSPGRVGGDGGLVDHARPGKPRIQFHTGPLTTPKTERVPRPVMLDIDSPDAPVPIDAGVGKIAVQGGIA